MTNRSSAVGLVLVLAAFGAHGQAKDCAELKAEIAAKMDANGVVGYQLSVIDVGATPTGTIVGGCGGGTRQIDYVRGGATRPEPASPEAVEPETTIDPQPTLPPEEDA
jgi:hypothetical protein